MIVMSCSSDKEADQLSHRWTQHQWHHSEKLYVDINHDGKQERAVLGLGKTVIVAVFVQDNVNLIDFIEVFTHNPEQQNSLCSGDASLSINPQQFDLAGDVFESNPPGYKFCEDCQGLILSDEMCDPFYIYWDHDSHQLRWWRI